MGFLVSISFTKQNEKKQIPRPRSPLLPSSGVQPLGSLHHALASCNLYSIFLSRSSFFWPYFILSSLLHLQQYLLFSIVHDVSSVRAQCTSFVGLCLRQGVGGLTKSPKRAPDLCHPSRRVDNSMRRVRRGYGTFCGVRRSRLNLAVRPMLIVSLTFSSLELVLPPPSGHGEYLYPPAQR
jgi:hypothetical protein